MSVSYEFDGSAGNDDLTVRNQAGVAVIQNAGQAKVSLAGVDDLQINPLDGADKVTVKDLSGTGIQDVSINLAGTLNGTAPDGQVDQVAVEGTQGADTISVAFSGSSASITGLAASVELTNVEGIDQLTISGLGGDDTITAANGFPAGLALTIDGGAGNDTIVGSDQADTLIGGSGNDTVTGGRGNDVALLGSGNDTFVWNPGDGSDTVEGQGGTDTLQFNGSNANENITISANGSRATLFRDVANITMDLNGVEQINVAVLGGTDHVTVNDLTGTDVKQVNVDLGAFGGVADGSVDTVSVVATAADDTIKLVTSGAETVVKGLAAETHVVNAESTDIINVQGGVGNDTFDLSGLTADARPVLALDGGDGVDTVFIKGSSAGDNISLIGMGAGSVALARDGEVLDTLTLSNVENFVVQGQGGDDTITAGNGFPVGVALTIDGGGGNDTITGGDQADTLIGGSGNDTVVGGRGNDLALLGSGNDTFVWNPGDGSDTVEGQGGTDTLQFNGSNANENITISANGSRATLFRDVANITMDLNGVEQINVAVLGGTDHVTVNDLTGTDVKQVNVDLGAFGGVADGSVDTVSVVGTAADETVKLTSNAAETAVSGLSADVHVTHAENTDIVNVQGGLGNDTFDLSSLTGAAGPVLALDGGDGVDTVFIKGSATGDNINLIGMGAGSVAVAHNGIVLDTLTLTNVENFTVQGQGGDDTITAGNGFPVGVALTIDGGGGNDTITGGDQADTLIGGSGNDTVAGGRGNDVALLGSGNDTFVWNPGDGSDIVEGQGGTDTLQFNGSNASENITISANGSRATLFRDVANITMDLNGMETLNVATLGGTDHVTVNDLTGTDVRQVNVDLGAFGGVADGSVDTVSVVGTAADETVKLTSNAAETVVSGLSADVHVTHAENTDIVNVQGGLGNDTFDLSSLTGAAGPVLALDGGDGVDTVFIKGSATGDNINLIGMGAGSVALAHNGIVLDTLTLTNVENFTVQGQGGDDTITAGNGFPVGVALTIDGGGGNDTITGGDQADTLIGGSGNDTVVGGRGNDVALLGSGNDTFVWNPGDGSDIVEGQGGTDTLQFNGSNASENITISANGSRATLFRDVANITMDLNGVETLNVATLGSADHVNVNDLTGTDVKQVNVDLGAFGGVSDGAADVVSINGTDHNDVVKLASNGTAVAVTGLHAGVLVDHGDTLDTISIHGGAGNDRIDASGVAAGGPTLVLDGGAGNDVLIGGAGTNIFVDGETVIGFDVAQDQLDLRAVAAGQNADWVLAHAHDDHGNVLFDFGTSQITLVGETVAQLHASDFILG